MCLVFAKVRGIIMGMQFRKILALLLVAIMLLGTLPFSAIAEGFAENDDEFETEEFSTERSKEESTQTASKPTMEITSPESGDVIDGNKSLTVKWESVDGASYYLFTAKNLTSEEYITEKENVGTKCKYKISGDDLPYGSSFRFWVGAYDENDKQLAGTDVTYVVYTSAEIQYDELTVAIKDPGEVTPGAQFIIRSDVSGGSGDYSFLWNWSHPDGTEMTDTRKNCSILGSVLGTYTFTLTVTDNETGESITSDKLTVEVKAAEEEYDPMEISFVGSEDEVEIELAMVGIAAECSVSGGSGNFEYAWDIERDDVNLQSYSYGMVDESCTWEADKVGVYTFRVTVKDLETGLTESASRSITVVQKEYDPLTLEITSAPTYADVGETVLVSAETTGGVGDVLTSWKVYLGNTCVASGTGLTAQFVPTSDGKYTVIVYAEDEAQTLEDRVTITAGSLVKCDLSVSCDSLYVGGEVEAQVTVQDSIGPFSYEWMLYLNDTFVSSDLDSESTTYSWSATQAGIYRIECTVYDIGKEELVGEMVWATDSAEVIANPNAVISGAFGEDSYTLTAGETLDVAVSASAENASLTRVTITVDGSGDDSHDSEDVSGSSWNGYLTLDGNVYPLNTPGTYTIKLFAKVDAGNPDWAEVDRATLIVTEAYEEPEKLADPIVTVTIDGTTMTATWEAVEGAERYVYSLRNLTDNDLIAKHIETNGCTISLTLEAGKKYKLAVGAVPAGITDTIANKTLLSWGEVAFGIAVEEGKLEKLDDPELEISIDGNEMTATWNEVEGAVRYVYSLKNLTDDDKLIADHEVVNGFSVQHELEYGKNYRFAVAAVPAGVSDTHADSNKCSWVQVEFNIATAEEATLSKVLAVAMDDEKNVVQPNEVVTLTVKCNRMTEYLDVYPFGDSAEGYHTLEDYTVDRDGFHIFKVTVKYSTSGKYTLRLVPMNANKDDWTKNREYWGYVDIVVCDHTLGETVVNGEVTYVGTGISENKTHVKETPYRKSCVCGENYEEYTVKEEEAHTNSNNQTLLEKEHIKNKGHVEYYVCICGDHSYTGNYIEYSRDLGRNGACSICRETYLKITDVQTMLKVLGYYSDKIDGKWGSNSKKAMEDFYKVVKGVNKKFNSIDAVDDATYNTLVEEYGKLTIGEGKILSPVNGAEVEFFKDGQMKVQWSPLKGNWKYTLTLKEGNTVIFKDEYYGNNVSLMSACIYTSKIKSFTEADRTKDHKVTISITASLNEG